MNINCNSSNYKLFNKALGECIKNENICWISPDSACAIGLTNNIYEPLNNNEKNIAIEAGSKDIPIEITTIDSLELDKLDYIKIDVEGYEQQVINGSINTIKKCKPIIILECYETFSPLKPASLEFVKNKYNLLINIGYEVQNIWTADFLFIPIEKKQQNNIVITFDPKIYSPKIIDCFIFYNELDLLNYRLNLLDDYVDYFVLVEATHTHTGKEKKLFYNENKNLFEKFKYKIIHIIVDDFPYKYPDIDIEKNQQWQNEHFQRNCIKRGIDKLSLNNKDIITICDLDEIPNPKILNELKDNKRQITKSSLKMDMYYYNLNNKTNINDWISPKLFSYNEFVKLFINKTMITDCIKRGWRHEEVKLDIIENGGWHLSYFGDKDFIINKIKSYTHQEFNNDEIISKIEEKIKSKKDLFNRENHDIQYIDIEDNDNLPPKYDIYLQKYINYNSIFNEDWYPDNQINDMCNLFNKVKELSGNIIEIGCWEGKSTSFLANKCYPEILICNDTWEGNIEESKISGNIHITEIILKQRDVYKIFINNMNLLTNSNYKIVRKDCLKWLQEYKEPIKFIHIDASHDYDSVYKTINLILPNLIKGGIICGDDFYNASIKNYPLNGGVEKAVKDTLPNYKNIGNLWYFINNSTLLQKNRRKTRHKI